MSAADDLVILNQAKALEGMRQRLRSHMMKLTDRQKMIDRMEQMIARRDQLLSDLSKTNKQLHEELKKALADRPEGYDSELTRKCQQLAEAREWIGRLELTVDFLLELI